MSILSAAIEPNGWVLAITYPAAVTPGAWEFSGFDRTNGRFLNGGVDQYPLDPDGAQRVVLTLNSAGHVRSSGQAAAATRTRTLLGVKAIRRPHPNLTLLSQVDNGNGTVTDRFALSDRVYSGDTALTLNLLAGWRVEQSAASGISVTNNSTRTAPLPISRWAVPPYTLVEGTVGSPNHSCQVDVIAASHHPENPADGTLHQAIAALELMATDGTTAKTFWFTAPQTSPVHGDNLRCWGGAIDLSGLNPGMITIHRRVWPWIGAPRATGTMGVAGHATSTTAAIASGHDVPLSVFYDPTGTRYGTRKRFVFIDATSPNVGITTTGTNDAGAVVFHTTLAAARAAALNTKPATLNVACQAARFFLDANTGLNLPNANGVTLSSATRAADFWEFTLTDGQVHTLGPAMTGTGVPLGAREGLVILQGDPDAADPRTNTILRSGTAAVAHQPTRIWWRNFRLEMGQATLFTGGGQVRMLDRVTVRGKAGWEASTNAFWASGGEVGYSLQTNTGLYANQPGGLLCRNLVRTRRVSGETLIGVRINTEAGTDRSISAFQPATGVLDQMVWNGRVFGWTGPLFDPGAIGGQVGGSGWFGNPLIARRFAVVNTLLEGESGNAALQLGEFTFVQLQDSIFDGLAVYGSRVNMHNEAPLPFSASGATVTAGIAGHGMLVGASFTVAGLTPAAYNGTFTVASVLDANRFTYTAGSAPGALTAYAGGTVTRNADSVVFPVVRLQNAHIGNAFLNCAFDRNATKQDTWIADGTQTSSHELLYGVGQRAVFRANRGVGSPSNWQYAWHGHGSETDLLYAYASGNPAPTAGWWGVVADNTNIGTGAGSLNGDYRPSVAAGSRLIGRARLANTDRDLDGRVRGASFAVGPLEADGATALVLVPGVGWHEQAAEEAGLAWAGRLGPAPAMHAQVAGAGRVSAAARLMGAAAWHVVRDGAAVVRDAAPVTRADGQRTLVVDAERRVLRPADE
jgi:hypothetical protein